MKPNINILWWFDQLGKGMGTNWTSRSSSVNGSNDFSMRSSTVTVELNSVAQVSILKNWPTQFTGNRSDTSKLQTHSLPREIRRLDITIVECRYWNMTSYSTGIFYIYSYREEKNILLCVSILPFHLYMCNVQIQTFVSKLESKTYLIYYKIRFTFTWKCAIIMDMA